MKFVSYGRIGKMTTQESEFALIFRRRVLVVSMAKDLVKVPRQ